MCLQNCETAELTGELSAFNSLSELVLVCLESIEDNNTYKANKDNKNKGNNQGVASNGGSRCNEGSGNHKTNESNLDVDSHDSYGDDTSSSRMNSNKINKNPIDDSRDANDINDYDNNNNIAYHNDNVSNNTNGSAHVSTVEEDAVVRATEESEQRQWLGSLLAGHPETFMAILDILCKHHSSIPPINCHDSVLPISNFLGEMKIFTKTNPTQKKNCLLVMITFTMFAFFFIFSYFRIFVFSFFHIFIFFSSWQIFSTVSPRTTRQYRRT